MEHINYRTMLEMARYGAGVVHPRAVRAGQAGEVPVVVRSTFSNQPGTVINAEPDQFPLGGIAILGSMESLVLEEDILGAEKRSAWEKKRLIMSLVDEDSGALVLAASSEKSHELALAQEELGPAAKRAGEAQAWVSLVGQRGGEVGSDGRSFLENEGIDVVYHERTDQRSTYVVPADEKERAVKVLYQEFFKSFLFISQRRLT